MALVACVAACVALGAEQLVKPQFKSGVTVTQVHVTVLDKRSRRHLPGLKSTDFIIEVDGRSQPVTSVAEVLGPLPESRNDPESENTPAAIVTNNIKSPRLFVIILNDAAGGSPFNRQSALRIADAFVDELSRDDLAAVVFVRNNRYAQDFTSDRALLRRAIKKYSPGPSIDAVCPMDVVRRAQEFLKPIDDLRRAIIFISPLHNPKCGEMEQEVTIGEIDRQARLAHVPIYTFSAEGLHAPGPEDLRRRGRSWRIDDHIEELRTVSGLTGGRTIAHTNAPEARVSEILEELRSYYTIGFSQTYPDDGRLRRVRVRTNRSDAIVVSSRTVIMPRDGSESGTAIPAAPGGFLLAGRERILDAITAPLPTGELPLRLAAVALSVPDAPEELVVLTLGLPSVTEAERFRIRLIAFDGEGTRQVASNGRELSLPGDGVGEQTEVILRLRLRPGRYNVRVAAQRLSDEAVGAVSTTVIVPDFGRERLTLSGPLVGRVESRRFAGDPVSDILPFVPTSVRAFRQSDRVGALVRVHLASPALPVLVTLRDEILDALGTRVFERTRTLTDADFGDVGAEHRLELPLQQLAPGEYLMRVTATVGRLTAQGHVRFELR